MYLTPRILPHHEDQQTPTEQEYWLMIQICHYLTHQKPSNSVNLIIIRVMQDFYHEQYQHPSVWGRGCPRRGDAAVWDSTNEALGLQSPPKHSDRFSRKSLRAVLTSLISRRENFHLFFWLPYLALVYQSLSSLFLAGFRREPIVRKPAKRTPISRSSRISHVSVARRRSCLGPSTSGLAVAGGSYISSCCSYTEPGKPGAHNCGLPLLEAAEAKKGPHKKTKIVGCCLPTMGYSGV